MIEFININKSFDGGRSFVVKDTSFTVEQGEFVGLIGESGSGKTTTLKMINRLEEPSSGMVKVNGENVLDLNPELLRRNIGYVFQGIGLFPHHTVAENVAAVPQLLDWNPDKIDSRCRETLELVGLPYPDFAHRMPDELSGGQQQRVGVARALAANPEVILMDEPFGALDPINRAALQEEFKRIQAQLNLTVIMVTHDMTEALLMADRIAVMKEGEVLQIGSPGELLGRPKHDYVKALVETPKNRAERLDHLIQASYDAANQSG